jgi:cysteine desulfurase
MHLDHNSGGRVRAEARAAAIAWLERGAANPSSVHAAGRRARDAIEDARDAVAALVGARSAEVVFTSGGTEANNLAILGAIAPGAHVVSSAIEHASVLRALDVARETGSAVTALVPDRQGRLTAEQVEKALRRDTRLVSIGWANGEIGTVQPIRDIAGRVHARAAAAPILVHADAVQAAGLCDIDVARDGVDLLSLSGHKLGALTGVGALIVRDGVTLTPRLVGGAHERERRAGTENVPGIVSFGVAARLAAAERAEWCTAATALRRQLATAIERAAAPVVRHGCDDGLPSTLSLSFPGTRGDALVIALDLHGIAASTGPACAAGAAEPSPVLRAIGCDDATAQAAVRFSFGRDFAAADVERGAAVIAACVRAARAAGTPGVGHAA